MMCVPVGLGELWHSGLFTQISSWVRNTKREMLSAKVPNKTPRCARGHFSVNFEL